LNATPPLQELTDEIRTADPELGEAMRASRQARLQVVVRELTDQVGRPTSKPMRSAEGDRRERGLTGASWPDVVRPPVQITDTQLLQWLELHPDHPDLVELQVRRRLERIEIGPQTAADEALIALLHRYMQLRPVDPFPHKKLAAIWLASDTPQRAIEHLEALDLIEEHSPVLALELARRYREQGDLPRALEKATRAVQINPYVAANRELAAAIAVQAGELDAARQHIVALTLIEPDRPQHARRLEAIDKMIAARAKS
jgi:tetratricopeptide (TPR) repeat protein